MILFLGVVMLFVAVWIVVMILALVGGNKIIDKIVEKKNEE